MPDRWISSPQASQTNALVCERFIAAFTLQLIKPIVIGSKGCDPLRQTFVTSKAPVYDKPILIDSLTVFPACHALTGTFMVAFDSGPLPVPARIDALTMLKPLCTTQCIGSRAVAFVNSLHPQHSMRKTPPFVICKLLQQVRNTSHHG